MASHYYGLDVGGEKIDVASGSSTTSKDIELQIDLAATNLERQSVFDAVEEVMKALRESDWPPA